MQSETLEQTIDRNLYKMLARQLDNSPATDDLAQVCAVWLEDLQGLGFSDADADRVEQGFRILGPRITRFPRVPDLIQAIPRRAATPVLKLANTQRSSETIAREAKHFFKTARELLPKISHE